MKKIFLILLTATFLFSACSKMDKQIPVKTETIETNEVTTPLPESTPVETNKPAEVKAIENTTTEKSYTASEVSEHSNSSSCWLILDNKVYDVTVFIPKHPG